MGDVVKCRYHPRQVLFADMASGALVCPQCRSEYHTKILQTQIVSVEHAKVMKESEPKEPQHAI